MSAEIATTIRPMATPAFDAAVMIEQHERWLRAVLYARLRCPDAVDEVLQEVSLAAVTQAARTQEIDRAGPWLYRVALRQVLLYRRKLGRRRKLMDRYTVSRPAETLEAAQGADPLQWLMRAERNKEVLEELEQLPSKDREMLLLKYSEGFSYEEIAEQIGMTASAVQSRLHRARGKLRQLLLDRESR